MTNSLTLRPGSLPGRVLSRKPVLALTKCVLLTEELRTQVQPEWKWRPAKQPPLPPRDMTTSHVFYTVRMIWNNTHPADEWVGRVKLYTFDPVTHPPHYLEEAILHLFAELETRTDLADWMKAELAQMAPRLIGRKAK